jgi:calcineurin-like phosphoesterase family protein
MIYYTSDSHYNHKNIVSGVSRWEDKSGCRDFKTKEEHDETVIKNINDCVKRDDVLFHLGDVAFQGPEKIIEFRNRIRCKTVHLILGNHDVDIHKMVELQQMFTTVDFYREININGQKIVLCHYPLRTWNKWHHGSFMLHGHCHGKLQHQIPASLLKRLLEENQMDVLWALANNEEVDGYCPNGRSLDVGLDTHPQFRPYSHTEILEIMKTKSFTPTDGHYPAEKMKDK